MHFYVIIFVCVDYCHIFAQEITNKAAMTLNTMQYRGVTFHVNFSSRHFVLAEDARQVISFDSEQGQVMLQIPAMELFSLTAKGEE